MTLRTTIASDAVTVFTSTDDFAEQVTYIPHQSFQQSATTPRTINAIVERQQVQTIGSDGGATVSPVWEIRVANSATYGIASSEIKRGSDQLSFPPRDGLAAVTKTITDIVEQDHGMVVLICR